MAVQYNMLWELLTDREIKRSAFTKMAGVSASTIAKHSHGISERSYRALACEIGDAAELAKEDGGE